MVDEFDATERGMDRQCIPQGSFLSVFICADLCFISPLQNLMSTHSLVRMISILFLAITMGTTAVAGVVRLNRKAEVSGGLIRLGDLAEISGDDEAVTARLAAVSIAPAPLPGKCVVVDFDTIRSRLAAQGISLSQIEFSGSSSVEVAAAGSDDEPLPRSAPLADTLQRQIEERLEKAMVAYLQDRSPESGAVAVQTELTREQAALLAAAASARYEISGGESPWTGQQDLTVKFFDRQGKSRQFCVRCSISPLPQVVVAARNLPKGHIVRAEDVLRRQLDADRKNAGLENPDLVVGRETTRTLRAGDAIRPNDIRGVPLVRRGDIVTVIAGSSGVRVRMEARSLGDGCAGEQIKLRSLDGKREVTATVTGYHEAAAGPAGNDDSPASNGVGVRLVNGRN